MLDRLVSCQSCLRFEIKELFYRKNGEKMNTLRIEAKLAKKYKYKPLSKDLSEKYRNFFIENIPDFLKLEGDSVILTTNSGSYICTGYQRIVVGDYGAFIEFDSIQASMELFRIKKGQEYRINDPKYSANVKYEWLTIEDGSDVKIYRQKKKVFYADYLPDMYYVSVHEVIKGEII